MIARDFALDPRRQQELRLRPYADAIYKRVFGVAGVQRFEQPDNAVLDRHFAIDVQLSTPAGLILTGQEKFLSAAYAKFNTVTVEYEQNQFTGEQGDWFKLASQFYFVGYESVSGAGFSSWVILNWPAVVTETNRGNIEWHTNVNRDGRAKASFRYCPIDQFPESCVIARSRRV